MSYLIPGNEPFFFPGGDIGCLLLHGFSATPAEMRPLGEYLASCGYSVIGLRLAGHATHPGDLRHTRWVDWLNDVEDGLALLSITCPKVVLIGQSMGGMVALTAATNKAVSAVITLSTPYGTGPKRNFLELLEPYLKPIVRKNVRRYPRDHPLYHRKELNYPAYPVFPSRITLEFGYLAKAMATALPQVTVPTLIIHSRADHSVPFSCMQSIYDHLGSQDKNLLPLDGMDHSIVLDPQHQLVFEAIREFISTHVETLAG